MAIGVVCPLTDRSTDMAYTSDEVWVCWNQECISSTASNLVVWTYWNIEHNSSHVVTTNADFASSPPIIITEEENHRSRQYEVEKAKKRKEAREKAEALLLANLSPEQRDQFKKQGNFVVHSSDKDRFYRVTYGQAGNVLLIEKASGKVLKRLCIHPPFEHGLPTEDVMLAQKLLLEADEKAFLKTANHHAA